jgi:hypothetical protein
MPTCNKIVNLIPSSKLNIIHHSNASTLVLYRHLWTS